MNTRLSTPSLSKNLFTYVNRVSDSYKTITNAIEKVSSLTASYKVRKLQENDEHKVKDLIKSILFERGGVGLESQYYDRELTSLYDHYKSKGHSFNVLQYKKEIIGTVALGPYETDDVEGNVCEVKKTYLKREFRGKGQGKYMMQIITNKAIQLGYDKCVVEIETRNQDLLKSCLNYGFTEMNSNDQFNNYTQLLVMNLN